MAREAERDYSHRDVLDKLGVKPGMAVRLDGRYEEVDAGLRERVAERVGREWAEPDEPVELVLAVTGEGDDWTARLREWRKRLTPNGGVWLLTAKRGRPGYVDQTRLISAGSEAGLVDNKVCSVSETTSAMRFVIRRVDRPRA